MESVLGTGGAVVGLDALVLILLLPTGLLYAAAAVFSVGICVASAAASTARSRAGTSRT